MPNEAFYKIDSEKRNKIIEAMKKEFGCNSFEKASINKIVEDAGISKGSFWCYFENKEEAINFIIETYIEKEKTKALELLEKNKGDIFKTYIDLYDFISEIKKDKEEDKDMNKSINVNKDVDISKKQNIDRLYANIFRDLIINREKIFNKFSPQYFTNVLIKNKAFNEIINISKFKRKTQNEIVSLIKLLDYAMRINLMDVHHGKLTEKEARENYLNEIEILKKGVYEYNA